MGYIEEEYDIEGLSQELELELEDIIGLFSGYITEMHDEVYELQKLLAEKNWDMLRRTVHNIKGVSVNLGVSDVFNLAEKLDIMLKNGEIQNADEYVQRLITLINEAEIKIRRFFKRKNLEI